MMQFHIISAFPGVFSGFLNESILKRAQDKGVVSFYVHDLRDYTTDKHRTIDDYPYGGGPGMILKPEPIFRAVEDIINTFDLDAPRIVLTSASGEQFDQKMANDFASKVDDSFIIICGHYKGIDERVRRYLATDELCIGNYVLTGGELPALIMIDSIVRLLPDVLGDFDSAVGDSFQSDLLDCDYYTRPQNFRGMNVPDVLLSGHHGKIKEWRKMRSEEITRNRYPENKSLDK